MRCATLFLVLLLASAEAGDLAKAKAAYDKADRALNATWRARKAELDPQQFARLQESQRNWLAYRDYVADFQMAEGAKDDPAKRLSDAGYLETAAAITEARVAFLRSWKSSAGTARTGTWTDSYGGRIEIVDRDGILYFDAGCVRGPTFHTGNLSGIARVNGDLARFSDRSSAPEKALESGETWLNFQFRGDGTLVVVGANTGHYHGARAYFDGEYRRTASLDDKAREKVVKTATAPAGG